MCLGMPSAPPGRASYRLSSFHQLAIYLCHAERRVFIELRSRRMLHREERNGQASRWRIGEDHTLYQIVCGDEPITSASKKFEEGFAKRAKFPGFLAT